jgi:hypothetical protein
MSGPEDDIAQAEKRRILREQATTMFQHAVSHANDEAGGRFAALGTPHVTGSSPIPNYPSAAAHQRDPVGTEPPLGYAIDDMPPLEPSTNNALPSPVEDTGGAPSSAPPDVAAPPPSSSVGDPDGFVCQPCQPVHDERAGSPSTNKDNDDG